MSEENASFDVIIAGGGPAGMAALLWCAELGLKAVLLEKDGEVGGQLLRVYNAVTNYLGIHVQSGRELRDLFFSQISGMPIANGAEIIKADLARRA